MIIWEKKNVLLLDIYILLVKQIFFARVNFHICVSCRGLIALEMMRQIEAATGQPIYKLFDFICGVSTGALIAAIVGIYKRPLDECERIYKKFSRELFDRSRILGASKLVTTHAYYDTNLWENILKWVLVFSLYIHLIRFNNIFLFRRQSPIAPPLNLFLLTRAEICIQTHIGFWLIMYHPMNEGMNECSTVKMTLIMGLSP